MNKNRYRLIFNKVRNMFVPVAEDVVAKPAGSQSQGADAAAVKSELDSSGWKLTLLSAYVQCAFSPVLLRVLKPHGYGHVRWSIVLSVLLPGAVLAQLTDQNGVAITTTSQGGVPVVNIVAPNANGLSHNKFQDFNVQGGVNGGLILNNSLTAGQSQITGAGIVGHNPNLTKSATAILNEVTGVSGSNIHGTMEVFGPKADVFIANPNGISVNGANTININSLTLTTGRVMDSTGAMPNFDITQGRIDIFGKGVNTEGLSYFDIVAKIIDVQGTIAGEKSADIRLIAGNNTFDGSTRKHTVQGGVGAGYGISASAAGAMYGQYISLISSDTGMGVKTDAPLTAHKDIKVEANGDVSVISAKADENIKIAAKGDLSIGGSKNDENLSAKKNIVLSSGSDIAVNNRVEGSDVFMSADKKVALNGASIIANGGSTLTGTAISTGGSVNINAHDLVLTGTYTATTATGDDIAIGAVQWDDSKSPGTLVVIDDTGNTVVDAKISSTASIQSSGKVNVVTTGDVTNNTGLIVTSAGDISIGANGTVKNTGIVMSQSNVNINAGQFEQSGVSTLISEKNLNISAGNLSNETTILSQQSADFNVSGNLTNLGHILGNTVTSTVGGTFTNGDDFGISNALMAAKDKQIIIANDVANYSIISSSDLAVTAKQNVLNYGDFQADKNIFVQSNQLENNNNIQSLKGSVELNTASQLLNAALIDASTGVTINGGAGSVNNGLTSKIFSKNGDVTITAEGDIENLDDAVITAQTGQVKLHTNATITNQNGLISGSGGIEATAGSLSNSGSNGILQSENGNIQVSSAGALLNQQGGKIVSTKGDIVLAAGGLLSNDQSEINANAGNVSLASQAALMNNQLISAAKNISLSAQNINNSGKNASIQSHAGSINVDKTLSLENSDGAKIIAINGDISLNVANTLSNAGAKIQANKGHITLTSGGVLNNTEDGQIAAAEGDIVLNAQGDLTNDATIVAQQGNVNLHSQATIINSHIVTAGLDLKVDALNVDNHGKAAALLSKAGDVIMTIGEKLTNKALIAVEGKGKISVSAGTISNSGAQALLQSAAGNIELVTTKGDLHNEDGAVIVASEGDVMIDAAGNLTNDNALINAQKGQVKLVAQASLSNNAVISAAKNLTIDATNVLNQGKNAWLQSTQGNVTATVGVLSNKDGATIAAQAGNVDLNATTLNNSAATIFADKNITVTTTGDINNTGNALISSAQGDVTLTGQSILNAQNSTIEAFKQVALIASADVTNNAATVSAQSGLTVNAQNLINENAAKILNASGNLHVDIDQAVKNTQASLIQNTGGNIYIDADTLLNDQAKILTGKNLNATLTGNVDNQNGGQIVSTGALTVSADNITNDGATIMGGNNSKVTAASYLINKNNAYLMAKDLALKAQNIHNSATIAATEGALSLDATKQLNNMGSEASIVADKGKLTATAENLNNEDGALIEAALADADITTTGVLTNNGDKSKIQAGNNLSIQANTLNNQDKALISAKNDLTAKVTQTLTNDKASIAAGNALEISAADIINKNNALLSGGKVVLDSTTGSINNSQDAKIEAQETLALKGNALSNTSGGRITSMGSLNAQIGAGGIVNKDKNSVIAANEKLQMTTAAHLNNQNQAQIFSAKNAAVIEAEEIENDNAVIQAATTLTLDGANAVNNTKKGQIQAGTDLKVTVKNGDIKNDNASLLGQNITLQASGDIVNKNGASVAADQALLMAANNLDNSAQIQAGSQNKEGSITANLQGQANNHGADGKILTNGKLTVAAKNDINNTQNALLQGNDVVLSSTQNINNNQANIQAINDAILNGENINNTNGAEMLVNHNIELSGKQTVKNQAKISAGNLVKSETVQFSNTDAGKITAHDIELTQAEYINKNVNGIAATNNASMTFTKNQDYLATKDSLNALANNLLTINAKNVAASTTAISNPGSIAINAKGDVTVKEEQAIITGKTLTVDAAGKIINEKKGLIFANENVNLKGASLDNNRGAMILASSGDIAIDVKGKLNNTAAKIEAGRDVTIDAAEFNNVGIKSGGVEVSSGDVFYEKEHYIEEGWNWSNRVSFKMNTLTLTSGVKVVAATVGAGRNININVKSKGVTNNDGGIIAATKNITTAGTVNNLSVVDYFDYLNAKIDLEIVNRKFAASGIVDEKDTFTFTSISKMFDWLAAGSGDAGWAWAYFMQRQQYLPADLRSVITQVVGTSNWSKVNFGEKWNAFKGDSSNKAVVPVYASQQSSIYAGGNINHTGAFNNGDQTFNGKKDYQVNVGDKQITTVAPELTSVTAKPLGMGNSLDQVASLTANPHLFGSNNKDRPTQVIDFANQTTPNKPDTASIESANAALAAINSLINNGQVSKGSGSALSTVTLNSSQNVNALVQQLTGNTVTGQVTIVVLDNGSVAVTVTDPARPTQTITTTLSYEQAMPLLAQASKPRPPIAPNFIAPTVYPLYETNITYIDQSQYFGSQYFFNQLGYNPGVTIPVIGDTYFEHQLLTQTIQAGSGTLLNDKYQQSGANLIQTLLDNGVQQGYQYGLTVGVAPTAAQLALLQDDIVWYVAKEVDGMTVLVPQVFLAPSTQTAMKDQTNIGGAIVVAGGKISIDGGTSNVNNINGQIKGGQGVNIVTQGDVFNVASANSQASIQSGLGGTASITAGNILNQGANIIGSNVNMTASNNIDISTTMSVDKTGKLVSNQNGGIYGDNVSLNAGKDVTVTAAKIGGTQQVAIKTGGNLQLNDVHEYESSVDRENLNSYLAIGSSVKIKQTATSTGSDISTNKLVLDIGGNANITGSNISAQESNVNVKGDMKIATGVDYDYEHKESWGFGLSASAVAGAGGHEAGVSLSTLSSAPNTHAGKGKTSGANASVGIAFEQSKETTNSVTNHNSQINFGSGTVTVGGNLDIGGADINTSKASQDATLAVTAGSIDTTKYEDKTVTESSSNSFFLGGKATASSSILNAATQLGSNIDNLANQDWQTGTGGANGVAAAGAISTVALNAAGVAGAVTELITGDLISSSQKFAFEFSNTNSTKTTTKENTTKIGGNISLTTTKGDINLNGVQINGGKVDIDSAGSINMAAAKTTVSSTEWGGNVSISAGIEQACSLVGCGAGYSGGVSGGYNNSKTDSTSYQNTQINGSQVTLNSKKDLNMVGANVSADIVNLDVKGNTKIESVQDTVNTLGFNANVDLSAGLGGNSSTVVMVSGGATVGGGANWENTAKVKQQAGIDAKQSITANVGGDLTLTGASIVSQTGAGDINVDGKIVANVLKDKQEIDGYHGSVGVNQSISGMTSVSVSGGRDESTYFGADNNATIAVNSVKSQEVVGTLNTNKDQTSVVTMNEKWAGADFDISVSVNKKKTQTDSQTTQSKVTSGGETTTNVQVTKTGGQTTSQILSETLSGGKQTVSKIYDPTTTGGQVSVSTTSKTTGGGVSTETSTSQQKVGQFTKNTITEVTTTAPTVTTTTTQTTTQPVITNTKTGVTTDAVVKTTKTGVTTHGMTETTTTTTTTAPVNTLTTDTTTTKTTTTTTSPFIEAPNFVKNLVGESKPPAIVESVGNWLSNLFHKPETKTTVDTSSKLTVAPEVVNKTVTQVETPGSSKIVTHTTEVTPGSSKIVTNVVETPGNTIVTVNKTVIPGITETTKVSHVESPDKPLAIEGGKPIPPPQKVTVVEVPDPTTPVVTKLPQPQPETVVTVEKPKATTGAVNNGLIATGNPIQAITQMQLQENSNSAWVGNTLVKPLIKPVTLNMLDSSGNVVPVMIHSSKQLQGLVQNKTVFVGNDYVKPTDGNGAGRPPTHKDPQYHYITFDSAAGTFNHTPVTMNTGNRH